jgi:hypothetical protein
VASKRDHKVFHENQSLLSFDSSFQNCFWNLFSTSGSSSIWQIRNVWKLLSPFSRNTLIASSEKTSWILKTSFWKKNCQINLKITIKSFSLVRLPCKFLNFMVLGYPSMKSQNHGNPYTWKIFMTIFELFGQIFFQNNIFKLLRRLFRARDQSNPWERYWKFPDISYFPDLR